MADGISDGVRKDDLVDGRYRVESRIGSGGMADVYCARDEQLGRKVALKVLHRRFAEDEEFVERFRREASSAAGLQHPNVVQVFDRGSWDGTYYIAMEFLPGRSLKQIIREEGPLDPVRAVDIAIGILRAARFAHKRGIVHRDIKPHNVIVDPEGRVKVTDFGIARAGASDMTETGAIMGTAAYLSPEQAQGHAVAATSDLYSIGIVLYEMLTGRVPFEADSAVTIALKQVSEDPVPPRAINPAVSPELEDVVLQAMQKDPARRFPDADSFIAALEEVRDLPARPDEAQRTGQITGVYPAIVDYDAPLEPYDPVEEEVRSTRFWLGLLLAIVALAAIGIGAYLLLKPDTTVVPKVVGLDADVAATKLNDAGFEADIQQVRSADRPEGEVIRQRPSPGEKAEEGSRVTIFVSSGPGTAEVPDVSGRPADEARRALERKGFKVDTTKEFDDVVDKGKVIETRPAARTPVNVGTTVTMVVSRGREQVTVPDVVGDQRDVARANLEDRDLRVDITEQESTDKDPGTVLAQDPAAGTKISKGDTVTLTVAKEPSEVAVPDVRGAAVNDALDALTEAGFRPRQTTVAVDTADEDGFVVDQDPGPGQRRKKGSRVTIQVGRFDDSGLNPEGDATPEPTPTPTP
jgi:beta-lactam-binding protein with PASTA domain/predicted Ser/Thr protein kinase